ncbi:hypothetical protein F5B18DRAFT_673965 [Nemania serpens]|nr:hypothetical protein F5B18DRAFT_673965 [Nemania serpens]
MPGSPSTRPEIWGLLSLFIFVVGVTAQHCQGVDINCHNALFPCDNSTALADAVQYCSTVVAHEATNYPAQATGACGNASKSPYIAACRCPVDCQKPTIVSDPDSGSPFAPATLSVHPYPVFTPTMVPTDSSLTGSFKIVASTDTGTSTSSGGMSTLVTLSSSTSTEVTISLTSSASGNITTTTSIISSVTGTSSGSISDTSSGAPTTTTASTSTSGSGSVTSSSTSSTSSALTISQSNSSTDTSTTAASSTSGSGPLVIDVLPNFYDDKQYAIIIDNYDRINLVISFFSLSIKYKRNRNKHGTESQTQSTSTSTSTSPSNTSTSTSTSSTQSSTLSSPTTTTSTSTTASCTTTPSDTGILENGDFETGLSPWSVDLLDLFSTTYALVSSNPDSDSNSTSSLDPNPSPTLLPIPIPSSPAGAGAGANGSCTAFAVSMSANPQTPHLVASLRLRSDLVFSRPGAILHISFSVRFARRNDARLVVSANGRVLRVVGAPGLDLVPQDDRKGGEGEKKGAEEEQGGCEWTRVEVDYAATDRLLQLSFAYVLGAAPENTIWLDQVAIFPSAVTHPPGASSFSSLSSAAPATTTLATAVRAAH